ncbi:MAG TPA: hypothetical protein DHN33_11880 [Eubacteriaceae bacterium]|nr:hypothetical protein [Eubacteriaceae bacterium]
MNRKWFITLLLVALLFVAVGCGGGGSEAENLSKTALSDVWGVSEDAITADAESITESTGDSHYMMAAMILSGAGMDNDLSVYDSVYLVEVQKEDGSSANIVVVEEGGSLTEVIPETVKSGE